MSKIIRKKVGQPLILITFLIFLKTVQQEITQRKPLSIQQDNFKPIKGLLIILKILSHQLRKLLKNFYQYFKNCKREQYNLREMEQMITLLKVMMIFLILTDLTLMETVSLQLQMFLSLEKELTVLNKKNKKGINHIVGKKVRKLVGVVMGSLGSQI